MSKLVATFQERFGDWLTALGQHLQLSLLTLLLAIFLAVPLAILFEYPQKNKQLGFTDSWDLPDHSFHGSFGPLHSYYGNWDASGLNSSCHLMPFSPSFKIPLPVYKGLIQALKKQESPLG